MMFKQQTTNNMITPPTELWSEYVAKYPEYDFVIEQFITYNYVWNCDGLETDEKLRLVNGLYRFKKYSVLLSLELRLINLNTMHSIPSLRNPNHTKEKEDLELFIGLIKKAVDWYSKQPKV